MPGYRGEHRAKRALYATGRSIDDRFGAAKWGRKALRKAFPDHWSFFLGEMALYSFIILILTGTFLTLFFKPSMTEVIYHGSYIKLHGVRMSEAYQSTLHISFDIRGGLLMRQIHHWAALMFVASIALHALRMFFTGAFRKPRELNWVIGTTMFALAAIEGFAGYSLPDDLLSGTGVRIAQGIMLSVPVVGTYISFFVFGGQYPGDQFIPRLYIFHVLLVPGILIALVSAHLMILWHQGHTQWPGKKQRDDKEVGDPTYPIFVAKTSALFFIVAGTLTVLAFAAQINPIWLYGPYDPVIVSSNSQPDWYFGFLEGTLRMMPGVVSNIGGHTLVWNVFLPAAFVPFAFFLIMGVYPFVEQWATGDKRIHLVLDRPRNAPSRTGLGVAIMAMGADIQIAGADDVIAYHLNFPIEDFVWVLRIGFFVFPVIGFFVTRHICLALQRADRRKLRRGETYAIAAMDGAYIPVARPVSDEEKARMEARQPADLIALTPRHLVPVPTPRRVSEQVRARLNHFYTRTRLETPSANPDGDSSDADRPAAKQKSDQ
ncbi:MAG: ubiquinol-cytochrome c reductase cytochrome b subunit [Streptosporangiaceae bacterium]|nr:ubiquinol-cytochrome c reductase cytochrome b subunit [Streptosporangiaceae bacterium]